MGKKANFTYIMMESGWTIFTEGRNLGITRIIDCSMNKSVQCLEIANDSTVHKEGT